MDDWEAFFSYNFSYIMKFVILLTSSFDNMETKF